MGPLGKLRFHSTEPVTAQFLASAPPIAAPAPAEPAVIDKLVGNYNVNYGAQSVVTNAGLSDGYTVTAKGLLHWKLPNSPTASCNLPDGTVIAKFSLLSGQISTYVGHEVPRTLFPNSSGWMASPPSAS
jgi:hypothetical protein